MKKALVALVVLIGLLVLAGIAAVLLVDVDAYKPRLESAVSDALGMEFRIRGKAALRVLPPAGVSFSDLSLRNRGSDLAAAESFRVGVKLLPLLQRRVEVTELIVERPVIRLEKGEAGRLNNWTPPVAKKPPPEEPRGPRIPFSVANAAVRNGTVVYVDRKSGEKTEIAGIDLAVTDLSLPSGSGEPLVNGIRFSGTLGVKKITGRNLDISDVDAKVTASRGVVDIHPFTMKLFGGKGEGEVRADLSKEKPALSAKYKVSEFRAEASLAALTQKQHLSGPLTLSEDLSFRGDRAEEMKRTAKGRISLRGEKLTVHGMDIDGTLSSADLAMQLNLVDLGTFVLTGPLGDTATMGYSFAGIDRSAASAAETRVTRLVSDWAVHNGIAEAEDVAFATPKNRIAMKGRLDIVNQRFLDVTVAVLDAKGCAKLRQRITGPFRKPQVDRVTALEAVAAPILGLFKETRHLLDRSECKPFYTGSVPHPG